MSKKTRITQEEVDKMLEEKLREYERDRTAWVVLKNGYTYVGYNVADYVTDRLMDSVIKLIELMGVEFSIKYPFGEDKEFYVTIEGEDEARAEFIHKFLNNNYKLSW